MGCDRGFEGEGKQREEGQWAPKGERAQVLPDERAALRKETGSPRDGGESRRRGQGLEQADTGTS